MNRDKDNTGKNPNRNKESRNNFKKPSLSKVDEQLSNNIKNKSTDSRKSFREKEKPSSVVGVNFRLSTNNPPSKQNQFAYVATKENLNTLNNRRKSVSPVMKSSKGNRKSEMCVKTTSMMISPNNPRPILKEITTGDFDTNSNNQSTICNANTLPAIPTPNNTNISITINSSQKKRTYSTFATETESEKENFEKIQNIIDNCYLNYIDGNDEWIENFKQLLTKEIFSIDENTSLPISLSTEASKVLNLQKFWIVWIENIKLKNKENNFPIQNLINIFNESFNNINEENLIKSFYLTTMKQINSEDMKEYFKEKLNVESLFIPTNKDYFNLLEAYAQFLLRSNKQGQSQNSSDGGKKMKLVNSCDKRGDIVISNPNMFEFTRCGNLNLNLNINLTPPQNFNEKNDEIVSFKMGEQKCDKHEDEDKNGMGEQKNGMGEQKNGMGEKNKNLNNILLENNNNLIESFITPMQSKKHSLSNPCGGGENANVNIQNAETTTINLPNSKSAIENKTNNDNPSERSELRDVVDPLMLLSQRTEYMMISQNTIAKQTEFIKNLQNADIQDGNNNNIHDNYDGINFTQAGTLLNLANFNFSQNMSQLPNEDLANCSVNANLTQETDYQNNCSFANSNYPMGSNKIKDGNNNINADILVCEAFIPSRNIDGGNDVIDDINLEGVPNGNPDPERDIIEKDQDNDQSSEINSSNESQEQTTFIADKARISKLIQEIEDNSKRRIDEEKLDKFEDLSQNTSYMNGHHSAINLKRSSTGKSRSYSRSKSRGRKYQSVDEEFPSDLVEGSIQTFNQSFNGVESCNKSLCNQNPNQPNNKEENHL
jgi:hypothetical protein